MRKLIRLIEAAQSLEVLILKGEQTLEWIRQHDAEDAASEIKYFIPQYAYEEMHVLVIHRGELAAMGGFQINPHDPGQLWVKFISTRPAFQRRGFARLIYEKIYPWAEDHDLKIAPGSLSSGGARMVHIHGEMYARHPKAAFARDAAGNYLNDRGQIVRSSDITPMFESAPSLEGMTRQFRNQAAPDFAGSCEGTSGDLAIALNRLGIPARAVEGMIDYPFRYDGRTEPSSPHCWVEVNGTILDPTVEQFGVDHLVVVPDSPLANLYHEQGELDISEDL